MREIAELEGWDEQSQCDSEKIAAQLARASVACEVATQAFRDFSQAAQAPSNFGYGTIGHQAAWGCLCKFNQTRNQAKKARRKLKGKK